MDAFVRVFGMVSKGVEKQLFQAMGNWPANSNSCILFVDFSDFDIPIGTKFSFFATDLQGKDLHNINGKLVQVTQSFFIPFDEIPKGHKTICEIVLDEPSLNLLRSNLPTVSSWHDGEKKYLLGITKNLAHAPQDHSH